MGVEVLDLATIVGFVEDEEAFDAFIGDRFSCLDIGRDSRLSCADMLRDLQGLWVLETHFRGRCEARPRRAAPVYGSLFVQFDHNPAGSVDLEELKAEMRRMMLAMADELGSLPVHMVLEEDSFLKKAVDRELTRLPA